MIGKAGLSSIVRGPFLSAFTGYMMDKDEIRKGYAAEALAELIRAAFEDLGLHRLEANIIPRNEASRALAEKAGFRCEGESPKYLKINGRWEDHAHYVIRNESLE